MNAGTLLRGLNKPWFTHQPLQLLRRAVIALSPPTPGYRPLRTSWGVELVADPTRTIGQSIHTTGIYDLAVSEALVRLIDPGETVIDAGANIGHMTLLAALATGAAGRVLAFEPHPEVFAILQRNVEAARARFSLAATDLHQLAVSDRSGSARLVLPAEFESNDGLARLEGAGAAGGRTLTVSTTALDEILGPRESVGVMKIDVEGAELAALSGARRALEDQRIHHIIFEDHDVVDSEVVRVLQRFGYVVFSLGWRSCGLALRPVEAGTLATSYEAPNYIASISPDAVLARCSSTGWSTLTRRLVRRRPGR